MNTDQRIRQLVEQTLSALQMQVIILTAQNEDLRAQIEAKVASKEPE